VTKVGNGGSQLSGATIQCAGMSVLGDDLWGSIVLHAWSVDVFSSSKIPIHHAGQAVQCVRGTFCKVDDVVKET